MFATVISSLPHCTSPNTQFFLLIFSDNNLNTDSMSAVDEIYNFSVVHETKLYCLIRETLHDFGYLNRR